MAPFVRCINTTYVLFVVSKDLQSANCILMILQYTEQIFSVFIALAVRPRHQHKYLSWLSVSTRWQCRRRCWLVNSQESQQEWDTRCSLMWKRMWEGKKMWCKESRNDEVDMKTKEGEAAEKIKKGRGQWSHYSFGVRGEGVKAGGRVGDWGPSFWEHLLDVRTQELGKERQREEASDRVSHIEAAWQK